MLLTTFGLAGILGIVFMETGLLIGFIFPGDTLLFTAGIMAAADPPFTPLWTLLVGIPIAAALGDQLGFFIGRKAGPRILRSRVMKWIGPEAVEKTNHFFDKYGVVTVLFARFIGVVRTVTPVVAGFSHMNHRAFTLYSVLGSVLWGSGIPFLGYMLGGVPFVQEFMHWFIVAGLATVFVPMSIKILRLWWKNRGRSDEEHMDAAGTRQDTPGDAAATSLPETSDVAK
ncbi:Inner membrane protein YqjA [Corynebacterium freiburgense]|nr:Inner membrane protein YqjA [Corynebacterium freiburgense]